MFHLQCLECRTSTHRIIIPWKMSCLEGANFSGLVATSVISTKTDMSNQVSFPPTTELKMLTDRNFLNTYKGLLLNHRLLSLFWRDAQIKMYLVNIFCEITKQALKIQNLL